MTRRPSVGVGGHSRGMSSGMGISRCGRVTPLSSRVQSISLWAGHGDFGASTQSHESGHPPWAERECVDSTLRRRADDRWRVPMEGDGEVAFVWFAHTNDGYVSRRVGLLAAQGRSGRASSSTHNTGSEAEALPCTVPAARAATTDSPPERAARVAGCSLSVRRWPRRQQRRTRAAPPPRVCRAPAAGAAADSDVADRARTRASRRERA
jgi:hypothetical protein